MRLAPLPSQMTFAPSAILPERLAFPRHAPILLVIIRESSSLTRTS